jgi:citrate synthase
VVALIEEAERIGAEEAVRAFIARGDAPAGFGQRPYPDGDPRAAALLAAFTPPPALLELKAAAEELTGERANIDFALAVMTRTLGLPADAPLSLFALGRSVGWIAHAMEQLQSGDLIRPRARYVGPPPEG